MALFDKYKKQKPEEPPSGRRRPQSAEQATQRAQAFSYYAQRSVPQANTGRGQTQESSSGGTEVARPWYLHRVSIIGGTVLIIIGGLFLTALSSNPKIVPLTNNGNAYFLQDLSLYQESADKSLSHSVFNKNKLTIDTAGVSKDLKTEYPEIADVTVTTPLIGHQPVVYISPYQSSFILTTKDSKAYLLDVNGRALAANSQITTSRDVSVPTLEDMSGLAIQLGSQALPAGTVHFAQEVVALLDAGNVGHSRLVLPPASSELDVYITGKPYFVKFNLQGDAKLGVGTFLATQQRLEKDKVTPAQYIDVRVNERAYYK
jgi:hypothetical protein